MFKEFSYQSVQKYSIFIADIHVIHIFIFISLIYRVNQTVFDTRQFSTPLVAFYEYFPSGLSGEPHKGLF